jgi:molybdopterin-containing oxidoreductase family membrane subunit
MATCDTPGVLAVFPHGGICADAVRAVKQAGRTKFHVYSPIADHRVVAAIGQKVSPLGLITLAGALTGFLSAIGLTSYAAASYKIVVMGKPFLSWIPWVVIDFEFTILFGCLSNFIGMLALSGLPRRRTTPGYDPRFSDDKYGIFVPCEGVEREQVMSLLREHGAAEVHEQ